MDDRELALQFARRLRCQIEEQKNPFSFSYICKLAADGKISGDELAELRGFYKGLKVARGIAGEVLCRASDYYGEDECSEDCRYYELCLAFGCIEIKEE